MLFYGEILMASNEYRRNFDRNQQIKGGNSSKYINIIKPFLIDQRKRQRYHSGSALMNVTNDNIKYVYWDDPNEIVNRLRLLISSQNAGHNNHKNEIVSIIDERSKFN